MCLAVLITALAVCVLGCVYVCRVTLNLAYKIAVKYGHVHNIQYHRFTITLGPHISKINYIFDFSS